MAKTPKKKVPGKTSETPEKNPGGRPPKYTDPKVMQTDIDAYFALCKVEKRPRTVMGLALALDMCRDTLCEYAKNGKFSDTVKRAKNIVIAAVEEMLLSEGSNKAGGIFWMKNNGGYNDTKQLEHTGKDGGPIETTGVVCMPPKAED